MSEKESVGPRFRREFQDAYNDRGKNLVVLTGGVLDLFWSEEAKDFVSLDEALRAMLGEKFIVLTMDMANGIRFPDKVIEDEVVRVCESRDGRSVTRAERRTLIQLIESNRHAPLPTLVLLQGMTEAFRRVRQLESIKPLAVVMQYAGALFPDGNLGQLPELDRQRLVTFLSWVNDPRFVNAPDLVVLVHTVRSELNRAIFALPNVAHLEIPLPPQDVRERLVNLFVARHKGLRFEGGKKRFATDTAGLTLEQVKDLLEVAERTGEKVTRGQIVGLINEILQAKLGDIIRVKHPTHGPDDVIGYAENKRILKSLFERCEDPSTAVSAVLVSGPNGSGKTFQFEAFAESSGRVVIELAGLRGSYYGETDKFFELLRWHIATLGKVLIFVDEAHTAFGSVHKADSHETERRLSGNIIKMMSDKTLFARVLWVLMTSRPDELDPDVKSRSPIQIPIFDLEGQERRAFVKEMFGRKRIELEDAELDGVLEQTAYYSSRDFDHLVREVLAERRKDAAKGVLAVLEGYRASRSIIQERTLQGLLAALHCTYPQLLPAEFKQTGEPELMQHVAELKRLLRY